MHTNEKQLETAVLFITYKRLDTTVQVFKAIKQARPKRLYISSNIGRNTEEIKQVVAVRKYLEENIDWECQVSKLIRTEYLSAKFSISGAIDWFFENEEMGIILEDDCLPSQSFFCFCEELLEKYKGDMRIGQISGFNPLGNFDFNGVSYGFSKFGPIWGWASWRRAWKLYDVNMKTWPEIKKNKYIDFFTDSQREKEWRESIFDKTYKNEIDTWDYQWSYSKLISNQLSIIPHVNLIKNIGFGSESTHTTGKADNNFLVSFEILDVNHTQYILRNKKFDHLYMEKFVKLTNINQLKNKVKQMIKKLLNKFFRKTKKWNLIIDKITTTINYNEINCKHKRKANVSQTLIVDWLTSGNLEEFIKKDIHKKGLEFFFSSYLLELNENDIVLDAAGGKSNYLQAIKLNSKCKELYLTDHIYEGIHEQSNGVKIVGGDISSIHLMEKSINKIACHHAFEHFQDDKDMSFIKEAYRILKENGILVVIPLFLTDKFIECWNIETNKHFDKNATFILDKTASIPGADDDGHFARFYDNDNLLSRIIIPAEELGFKCEIVECEVDGESVPNMKSNFGSIINKPTRALVFTKE